MVHPGTNRLVRQYDSSLRQQILDVARAQGEPQMQPDRLSDGLGREAAAVIADCLALSDQKLPHLVAVVVSGHSNSFRYFNCSPERIGRVARACSVDRCVSRHPQPNRRYLDSTVRSDEPRLQSRCEAQRRPSVWFGARVGASHSSRGLRAVCRICAARRDLGRTHPAQHRRPVEYWRCDAPSFVDDGAALRWLDGDPRPRPMEEDQCHSTEV
jgi:hypothetical protein